MYGNYEHNVGQDPDRALQLWRKVMALARRTPQYRINPIRLLIATGQREEALRKIEILRAMDRVGANEFLASQLRRSAEAAPAVTLMTSPPR